MDRGSVLEKVRAAIDVAGELETEWRVPTFQVLLAHLLGAEPESNRVSTPTPSPRATPVLATGLGLGEFLALFHPTNHPDTVEAILHHGLTQGVDSLNATDIVDGYRETRRKPPKNLSDVLKYCIRRGHVVVAPDKKDGKKAWQITPGGDRYVEERLQTAD